VASNKILVIDDSRVIRMRVKEMLPPGNFDVLEAKDGLEGMNLIRQEKPNLIMLDFLLPKLSGWEVYQQIQQSIELQKIPLVLMSGRKEEVVEKIPEPFEYFEFIPKPFEQKDLIGAIKAAMAKSKLPRQGAAPTAAQPATAVTTAAAVGMSSDVQVLNEKIATMQADIERLKQQMAQVMAVLTRK
jgi:CheY-like chemotaxis protein